MPLPRSRARDLSSTGGIRYAQRPRVPSRRVPADVGRPLPLSIPNELGDASVAESADCILAKERPGCLSLRAPRSGRRGSTRGSSWSSRRCGRASSRNGSARCSFSAGCSPPGTGASTGWARPAGNSRGISRVPRRGARGGGANHWGGRVRGDLEARGLAEISRRPDAAIPPPVRSTVEVTFMGQEQ